ncbi:MAG: M48 family metalloprotease [Pirellulales bacterium]|nr:M48 family metalloprotease [Pirellulales bacterium]
MNFSDMLPAVGAIDQGYCLKLTAALLHFLWQGCAVALLYGLATFALRHSTAAARHLSGVVALALMAACLPLTLCFLPSKQADTSPATVSSRVSLPRETSNTELAVEDDIYGKSYEVGATAGLSSSATHTIGKDTAGQAGGGTPVIPLYISTIYLCGVVLMLIRVVLGVWGVGRLRRNCTPVDDWAMLDIIRDCARRMALRAVPAVAYCRRIGVPMAVGLLRPMILLPAALASGLTPTQLQAVLLHEMAHLRRYDLIVNILQRLVEALLFFHPAVWWISRRVSCERENACDDLAARAGEDRLQYADALLRAAEICSVGRQSAAVLAATGANRSQLAARLRRLLGQDQRPTFRLTIVGATVSVLLAFALLLTPAMLRGAGDEAKKDQPVSMSADEFMRLTPTERRDLLVRVFQHRLEQADNLYYKTEQLFEVRKNNNGSPGELLEDKPESRFVYRHWRLNDSCRLDKDAYNTPDDAKPNYKRTVGVNAEEGLARVVTIRDVGERRPSAVVVYPKNLYSGDHYIFWLDHKLPQIKELASSTGEPLFPYLIRHKDEFKFEPAGDLIRLSVPWQPWWAEKPGGMQVCLLDPQKGFLPVKCDSRWNGKTDDGKPLSCEGYHTVKECRLVGDVWMPVKISMRSEISFAPEEIYICEINVLQIEHGEVEPSDLMVPFSEGMKIVDTVEGISYTSDAQGKPAGRFIANDKMDPPDWWMKRFGKVNPGAGGYSLASKISEADRKRLAIEEKQLDHEKAKHREDREIPSNPDNETIVPSKIFQSTGAFEFDPHSRRNIHSDINKAINNGASKDSELAVSKALKWIAQHQLEDGGWSFDLEKCPGCEGKCRNSGSYGEARIAATGLALLPFLGAGDTHKNEGPYQSAIQAGLKFLVDNMQKSAHGGKLYEPKGTMYSHGIGAIALCEAYGMTRDPDLLSPARETLAFICYAQDPDGGGWRYQPRQKGDTSVVGWQLTALRSGHAAGFQIPFEVVERTSNFLDSVQSNDGAAYGYLTPGEGEATTAAGLLCRLYLGWDHDNPALKRGVQLLDNRGPSPTNMYYNYYATQVMQYWGGEPWENWNRRMRDQLVQNQAAQDHEEGSWFTGSGDYGSTTGGRLYCTAMAAMILEVYYRSMFVNTTENID